MSIYLFFALTLTINCQSLDMKSDQQVMRTTDPANEEGLFLGSGINGVVITLQAENSGSDLGGYISHLDRSQSRIEALVPALGPGSFNSLLDIVGGEYSIDHRDAGIEANRSNPL